MSPFYFFAPTKKILNFMRRPKNYYKFAKTRHLFIFQPPTMSFGTKRVKPEPDSDPMPPPPPPPRLSVRQVGPTAFFSTHAMIDMLSTPRTTYECIDFQKLPDNGRPTKKVKANSSSAPSQPDRPLVTPPFQASTHPGNIFLHQVWFSGTSFPESPAEITDEKYVDYIPYARDCGVPMLLRLRGMWDTWSLPAGVTGRLSMRFKFTDSSWAKYTDKLPEAKDAATFSDTFGPTVEIMIGNHVFLNSFAHHAVTIPLDPSGRLCLPFKLRVLKNMALSNLDVRHKKTEGPILTLIARFVPDEQSLQAQLNECKCSDFRLRVAINCD